MILTNTKPDSAKELAKKLVEIDYCKNDCFVVGVEVCGVEIPLAGKTEEDIAAEASRVVDELRRAIRDLIDEIRSEKP